MRDNSKLAVADLSLRSCPFGLENTNQHAFLLTFGP